MPAVIVSVAHLEDEERALVLGVLLEEVLAWVRSLPGSQRLRALVVFDEVYGFLPPHPQNSPTKRPLVAMDYALTFLLYTTALFLAALEAVILWKMATNWVDLRALLSNGQGGVSLSRLQLLVFTFVIAAGFVYLTAKGGSFPVVNSGVLVLLGISGATYVAGKSLDRTPPAEKAKDTPARGAA